MQPENPWVVPLASVRDGLEPTGGSTPSVTIPAPPEGKQKRKERRSRRFPLDFLLPIGGLLRFDCTRCALCASPYPRVLALRRGDALPRRVVGIRVQHLHANLRRQ